MNDLLDFLLELEEEDLDRLLDELEEDLDCLLDELEPQRSGPRGVRQ